jgi:2Fe-2S ferredoxin
LTHAAESIFMPKVTFESADGSRQMIETQFSPNLMAAAVSHGIDGILAECGGSLACGTCHIYVELSDLARMPAMTVAEDRMLGAICGERLPGSRLSCQIPVTEELDGLIVKMPVEQG